jgi:hypothetical protein
MTYGTWILKNLRIQVPFIPECRALPRHNRWRAPGTCPHANRVTDGSDPCHVLGTRQPPSTASPSAATSPRPAPTPTASPPPAPPAPPSRPSPGRHQGPPPGTRPRYSRKDSPNVPSPVNRPCLFHLNPAIMALASVDFQELASVPAGVPAGRHRGRAGTRSCQPALWPCQAAIPAGAADLGCWPLSAARVSCRGVRGPGGRPRPPRWSPTMRRARAPW